ncbi:unnamed protein product [Calypogeia fissa]
MKDINVCSWNVRGLADPHRFKVLSQWVRRQNTPGLDAICLQELLVSEESAKFKLKQLLPDNTICMDVAENGWVGLAPRLAPRLALVIPLTVTVLEQGKKGDGHFCWAKFDGHEGPIFLGAIYAPRDRQKCIALWQWMVEHLPQENWIFAGDFNMLELPNDTTGYSSVIHWSEGRAWKRCSDYFDLVDALLCSVQFEGPIFTRQAIHRNRLDQARLDRVYCSNRAH